MAAQQVVAEIPGAAAPHFVHVVAVALRVVVLEHEVLTLDAVVVRLARLGAADPREADLVDAGIADALHLRGRGLSAQVADELREQFVERVRLRRGHLRDGEAFVLLESAVAARAEACGRTRTNLNVFGLNGRPMSTVNF